MPPFLIHATRTTTYLVYADDLDAAKDIDPNASTIIDLGSETTEIAGAPYVCDDCQRPLTVDDHAYRERAEDPAAGLTCDNCHEAAAEAAAERAFEAYHGGSGPQTEAERYAEAARVKRDLRRGV